MIVRLYSDHMLCLGIGCIVLFWFIKLLKYMREGGVTIRICRYYSFKDVYLHVSAGDILRIRFRTKPIERESYIWLNNGFNPLNASFKKARDPEINVIKLKKIPVKPGHEIDLEYIGTAKPLPGKLWGSYKGRHILRPDTLWYPYVASENCLVWPRITVIHEHVTLDIEYISDYKAVSSLKLKEESRDYSRWSDKYAVPVELVIARFKVWDKGLIRDKNVLIASTIDIDLRRFKKLLGEIIGFYEEKLGLYNPYRTLNVAVIEGSYGFHGGRLLALDTMHFTNEEVLVATLAHEYIHTWIGVLLKPCKPDDLWLIEALTDYLALYALTKIGYKELANKILEKRLKEAQQILSSKDYKPPTKIHIPLSKKGEKIHRAVGIVFIHDVFKKNDVDKAVKNLTEYINENVRKKKCLNYNELLINMTDKQYIETLITKYKLKTQV